MTNIIFRKKNSLVLYSPRNCWNFNLGLKILLLNISILRFERGEKKSLENSKERIFSICPYYSGKKTGFDVKGFHLIREV